MRCLFIYCLFLTVCLLPPWSRRADRRLFEDGKQVDGRPLDRITGHKEQQFDVAPNLGYVQERTGGRRASDERQACLRGAHNNFDRGRIRIR
jgi:hypothetical protein